MIETQQLARTDLSLPKNLKIHPRIDIISRILYYLISICQMIGDVSQNIY